MNNRQTLELYWHEIKKYKTSFFIALFTIPSASLFIGTLIPLCLSQAIGELSNHNSAGIYSSLLLGAVFAVIGTVLNRIGYKTLGHHESYVRTSLSENVLKQLLQKDANFFIDRQTGAISGNASDFILAQIQLTDLLILDLLSFISSVGIGLAIVAAKNLPLAGILLFTVACLLLQVRLGLKHRQPYRMKRKELQSRLYGRFADTITNNQTVKIFAGENYEQEQYAKLRNQFEKAFRIDGDMQSRQGTARIAFMTIMQLAAVAFIAYLVLHNQLDLAMAIFTLTYLQRLSTQIFSLGDLVNGFDKAMLAATPMTDMLLIPNKITDQTNAIDLLNKTPTIIFKDVSYQYQEANQLALSHVSLVIPAGQKVGLVGRSGAGKTTMTHLLLRLSDVTDGSITIDNKDIRNLSQQSLRQTIAYVPQEPILFHRSLRDNIAYGQPQASDAEVREAARKANALDFIDILPKGFETLVGERGIKLSGGQRQRVAIARAILKNAPILVFDEATSALDSESESLIQQSLQTLMQDRTSIVIAHRLSTIARLDRVVVLDKGAIVEDGTHKQLLAQKGIYYNLWQHQSGGFIDE